ncbi:acyl-CoA reductase [Noviherbaspirillum autotrophicum]|uniref:Long-chain-fatty-acyl-CoA reductase n=1 Tax=Noviherbaspirillum autotrophicum TaxID=709839 RepID=A0A0C2BTQ3_9BURK|nr:acyl-CoA reductase [Noviherbaspirillum autotrophicum]KIF81401.1 hypothetical protein TSA66_12195 [Noviherbaspirillum autotrophicum]
MSSWLGKVLYPANVADLDAALDEFLRHPLASDTDTLDALIGGMEEWALQMDARVGNDVGLPFLKTWWRRSQLRSVLRHEFGNNAPQGPLDISVSLSERSWAPLGTVLHWPAGNVPIQPLLSLTGGILAGNRNIVRVPSALLNFVESLLRIAPASAAPVLERVVFVSFPSERLDLGKACAARSDGAMIWGGEEAVTSVRSLGFPHWARLHVFGPRVSVAMGLLDLHTLSQPVELQRLCRRLARETWQFDQQACSSPLALYVEVADDAARSAGGKAAALKQLVEALAEAFAAEERAHPRVDFDFRASVDVLLSRSRWLVDNDGAHAVLPDGPAWSLLYGGMDDWVPSPVHGKTLHIVSAARLEEIAARLDGSTQTIGIWIHDAQREAAIARTAHAKGVDRVVRIGLMHVFNTPWDGQELVRPLCRHVHFIPTRTESPANE